MGRVITKWRSFHPIGFIPMEIKVLKKDFCHPKPVESYQVLAQGEASGKHLAGRSPTKAITPFAQS